MSDADIEHEVNMIWDKIDVDRSGKIDYSEWMMGTLNKRDLLTDARLKKAFNLFDIDGSG
jgi:calcium-dependent protein kinase